MALYTKNGKPLHVRGDIVYTQSGKVVGQISGNMVFRSNGSYVGTIVYDRLVFRTTDSAARSSSFTAERKAGSGKGKRQPSRIRGDEPDIPD